ncbi:MAG: hypothetical protein GXO77_11405 [Calditrichaeota bacterium]|nr:hypothetical protein [Calditrichota bacterium]
MTRKLSVLILILILFLSCGKKIEQPKEIILVKIGDKTISKNEFIRRAEMTIRPPYCNSNYALHKKIILNSLIAEKLFAIEAGEDNDFIKDPLIQAHLQGRKEQAMRQWLYYEKAAKKVKLDTSEIVKYFAWVDRVYRISYVNLRDSVIAYQLYAEAAKDTSRFDEILRSKIGLKKIPRRKIQYSTTEPDPVLDALFTRRLLKGEVLKPIKVSKEDYLLIKINGWRRYPVITQSQADQHWYNITENLKKRKSEQFFAAYVRRVMKGKTIEFKKDNFLHLVDLLGPVYLKTPEEQKQRLKKLYWDKGEVVDKFSEIEPKLEEMKQAPVFSVGGKTWTVGEFMRALSTHPLVFRKKTIPNGEFGQQLQFAVMDLIRDQYLTKIAYEEGYDKINVVQRNYQMWKDSFNAFYYKKILLDKWGVADTTYQKRLIPVIQEYFNPYVDSLQAKYGDVIEINTDEFNKIKLTRIDMVATFSNLPYPLVVPPFPMITTDDRLDYGSKMKNEQAVSKSKDNRTN